MHEDRTQPDDGAKQEMWNASTNASGPRSTWKRNAIVALAITVLGAVAGGIAIAQQVEVWQANRAMGESCIDYLEGDACVGGICVSASPLGDKCSALCQTDADCTLTGWGCSTTRDPTGRSISVCRPRRI